MHKQNFWHNDYFEVKTTFLKANTDYQKAEEGKRIHYVKEPIGLDTQFLFFHPSIYQNKALKQNDNNGLKFGLRFYCNDRSVMQASNIQGKSFAIHNSLLPEARKI